ncbi:hypothetical protein BJV82DRAFT_575843 [Fennellomyces sp. T-0311]|nr:hypothetical protein BJV82DRAFT_575843 [Fennellomyces sp. T-0311]
MAVEHLALRLPEIVSIIIAHIDGKDALNNLYQCLFVNRLWQDCVVRTMYRSLQFNEHKNEYDAFVKFASMLSDAPLPKLSSPASLAVANPRNGISYFLDDPTRKAPQTNPNMRYDDERSQRLELYRRTLRSMTLRKIKESSSITQSLQQVGKHAVYLERLELYICDPITDDAVYPFLQHGTLTHLTLAGCYQISDAVIEKVANTCPQLVHLDLRACGLISDKSISAIARQCPKLRHLNVGRVRDRERISTASISLIAKNTQVAVLGLAGCDVTDECMFLLAKCRNRSLERISVNNCRRLTNRSIHAFVKRCTNLAVFEMKECHLINDWAAVAELVQRKVLLTLCDQQNRDCVEWAKAHGRTLHVRAPLK